MKSPPFNWFNSRKAVRVYRGNLPHWRQDGCLYFITFRLDDSIPRSIAAQWQDERRLWLAAHGIKDYPDNLDWKILFEKLPEKERALFHRMNARRLFAELDQCRGECLMRNRDAQKATKESMLHFDGIRWRTGDFIIMPNHVHALVQPMGGRELEQTLYSVKRFAAREINRCMGREGRVWQKEYYDHIVRNAVELANIRNYIADNPAKAKLTSTDGIYFRADWLDE
jgi:type I restriction enzyme R subunit